MGYEDDIVKYLTTLKVGKIISRKQIVENIHNHYGTKKGSIIPSDYCYNIVNYDPMAYDFAKGHPRLLEWVERGKYKYLGLNYQYNGVILHKGIPVGYWKNGKYFICVDFYRKDNL